MRTFHSLPACLLAIALAASAVAARTQGAAARQVLDPGGRRTEHHPGAQSRQGPPGADQPAQHLGRLPDLFIVPRVHELGVDRAHADVTVARAFDAHLIALGLGVEVRSDCHAVDADGGL